MSRDSGQKEVAMDGGRGRRRLPSIAVVLAMASLLLAFVGAAAQSDGRFYPETGHYLDARFISAFDNRGGVEILGFPITETFDDPETGRPIQYTENGRLEWDPGVGRAVISPLGELTAGWDVPAEPAIVDASGCRYFETSGHAVCHAFLQFFQGHGGQDVFGLPISEFQIEGDRIVQYFQYFRLDWYPDSGEGEQVQMAPLGREHFRLAGYDAGLLQPVVAGGDPSYQVNELRPAASLQNPTVTGGDQQEVYVVVRDQNNAAVPDVTVLLVVHLPSGARYFIMPPTDLQGLTRRSFTLLAEPPQATVNLEAFALANGLESVARDSFTIR